MNDIHSNRLLQGSQSNRSSQAARVAEERERGVRDEQPQQQTIAASERRDGGKVLPARELAATVSGSNARDEEHALDDAGQEVGVAIDRLNSYVQKLQREIHFTRDEKSGQSLVLVVDQASGEVIRQIPDDVALRLARNLNSLGASEQPQGHGGSATGSRDHALEEIQLVNVRA